ncbi:MAG: threonine/homoserine/homoserine lactone efflux protein [Gammaproteobacteria bacterium]|jgi:threonine/homoserine/homoserine lactone efflux protein
MDSNAFLLLVTACLAVNHSPGPSILFVNSIAAEAGLRAALAGIFSMSAAALGYVLLASTGLASLIAASPVLFYGVRIIGACYLIYLGYCVLNRPPLAGNPQKESKVVDDNNYFKQGLLVDLLNPKLGVFFLAFIPPFLNRFEKPGFLAATAYGCVFINTGIMVNGGLAMVIASGRNRINALYRIWIQRRIPGVVLVGPGLYLLIDVHR